MKYTHHSLTTHTFRNVRLLSCGDDEGKEAGDGDAVMPKKDMVHPDCQWLSVMLAPFHPYNICHIRELNSQPHYDTDHY